MRVLVVAQHNNQQLTKATLSAIFAAQQLSNKISVLIAGFNCSEVATAATKIKSVSEVIYADNNAYQYFLAENIAALCAALHEQYDIIVMPANTYGKNIMPRIAGLLDVDMVGDVIKILNANTFVRPMYAGNVYETVEAVGKPLCLTVRPTAFPPQPMASEVAKITSCNLVFNNDKVTFVSLQMGDNKRPDLSTASVIVSGGRALQTAENFKLIEQLADLLGGAVGASRAAVDAGLIGNDHQVGQTGKIVAPELYIAIGISGAIQHLAGIKDSKIIVAINQDKDAPIFKMADYGLVKNLFECVPELIQELKKHKE